MQTLLPNEWFVQVIHSWFPLSMVFNSSTVYEKKKSLFEELASLSCGCFCLERDCLLWEILRFRLRKYTRYCECPNLPNIKPRFWIPNNGRPQKKCYSGIAPIWMFFILYIMYNNLLCYNIPCRGQGSVHTTALNQAHTYGA